MKKFRSRTSVRELCKWAGVAKSSFEYKAHPGERGMKASTHTLKQNMMVSNAEVVEEIRGVLGRDYYVYGYHIMTDELRGFGYKITRKKVYRLMKEHRLLCGKVSVVKASVPG